MLKSIVFKKDWRCFKTGDQFEFRPGVNLIVGDQGCGKSSFIELLRQHRTRKDRASIKGDKVADIVDFDLDEEDTYQFWDSEKDNFRTKGYFDGDMVAHMQSMFASHGQASMMALAKKLNAGSSVVVLDEPDTSLSVRSCTVVAFKLKDLGCQIIAAAHSPLLIKSQPEVLSFDFKHQKWISSKEFIDSQEESAYEFLFGKEWVSAMNWAAEQAAQKTKEPDPT